MVHNILKNLVVSAIFLLIIACESPVGTGMSTHEHVTGNVTVIMPSIPRIELNDYTWQTLVTVYGLLESDNIESWCAAIYSLLSDEYLSHQIAENANKNMLDNYTWEVRAKKILES